MSSENVENISIETKEKKPTLSGKLEKYMVFGYWFLDHLHNTNTINDEKFNELKEELRMYSKVEEQTEFYEQFLDDSKVSSKEMKKDIRDHFKPKKEKKTRAVKDSNTVEKRGRKKKEVEKEPVDPLVAEMVAVANGEQPVVSETVSVVNEDQPVVSETVSEEKPKRKYNRKPKAEAPVEAPVEVPVVAPVEVPVEAPVEAPVVAAVEEKPKRKYNRKTKAEAQPEQQTEAQAEVPAESDKKAKKTKEVKEKKPKEKKTKKEEPAPAPVEESEEMEEVVEEYQEVRELRYNDEVYLIDDENTVYTLNQERIGVYNKETEEVEFDIE